MSSNESTYFDEDEAEEPPNKRAKVTDEEEYDSPDDSPSSSPKARASGGAELLMGTSEDVRSLHLLDEVQDDDASDDSESYDSEISEDEIDALLEEGLPDEMKIPRKQRPKASGSNEQLEMKEKVVLIEKGSNPFEILPEGWVEVGHHSGMPIYLHRDTRVCTFSRPYFLGSGSVRKHDVPLGSIPCLQYLRATDKEVKEKGNLKHKDKLEEENEEIKENGHESSSDKEEGINKDADTSNLAEDENIQQVEGSKEKVLSCPFADSIPSSIQSDDLSSEKPSSDPTQSTSPTKVGVGIESHTCESLKPDELLDYCKKRFEFKTMKLLTFRNWAEKRRFRRSLRKRNRPVLPEGTSLLSLKRPDDKSDGSGSKKDWVINPKGKSYLCILHEYLQQVLKIQPSYKFAEIENALTPYSATLVIGDVRYCTGYGSSKRQAKMESAKNTLEVLLPDFWKKFKKEHSNKETDLSYFDEIRIEDPRVSDLCNKTSELSPYSILLNCLQRNFGLSGNEIISKLVTKRHQKNEFVMTVGRHTVEVQCKNKRDGKHKAAQAILQKLHPHINNWGSLLRLYGNRSLQTIRERKPEMHEITLLQTSATLHQPNTAIIKKLKAEMLKLAQMKAQIQPIGKFLPPADVSLPTKHGSDLNNVVL